MVGDFYNIHIIIAPVDLSCQSSSPSIHIYNNKFAIWLTQHMQFALKPHVKLTLEEITTHNQWSLHHQTYLPLSVSCESYSDNVLLPTASPGSQYWPTIVSTKVRFLREESTVTYLYLPVQANSSVPLLLLYCTLCSLNSMEFPEYPSPHRSMLFYSVLLA